MVKRILRRFKHLIAENRVKRRVPDTHLDRAIQEYMHTPGADVYDLAETLGLTPVSLYFTVTDTKLRANIRARLNNVDRCMIAEMAAHKLYHRKSGNNK